MSQPDGTVELTIVDLARGGSGVARLDGQAVFVPFTAPGDQVRVRIVERQKRFLKAELVEVRVPSPDRVEPPCPVFGRCGGCQWQHLPYSLQWRTKVTGVQQALKRLRSIESVARSSLPTLEELPASQVWGYRNRVQLHGEGEALGYYGGASRRLVATDRCPIARAEIQAVWEQTRAEGASRFPGTEASAKTPAPVAYKVEVEVGNDGRVRKSWNSPHAALGFRQVHDDQNLRLREWVFQAITPGRHVYDLFGGAGNLSEMLAAMAMRVDCVDTGSPSPSPAGTHPQLHFHRSAVLPWLKQQGGSGAVGAPAAVRGTASAILDPPREGLADAGPAIVQHLERLGVREALLVGCDLDSWVRDLGVFAQRGWRFKKLAVLDLMPQTVHVESIALLVRPSPD